MRIAIVTLLLWSLPSIAQCQNARVSSTVDNLVESLRTNEEPKVTYRELESKSDLVVIATMMEKRTVANDLIGVTDFDRESVTRIAIKLKVLSVLKGEANDEIEMVSTEWSPKTVVLGLKTNFAKLRARLLLANLCAVEFGDEITDWGIVEGGEKTFLVPEYLLYLNRSNRENTYTPVTGQRWGGASVRLLNN